MYSQLMCMVDDETDQIYAIKNLNADSKTKLEEPLPSQAQDQGNHQNKIVIAKKDHNKSITKEKVIG